MFRIKTKVNIIWVLVILLKCFIYPLSAQTVDIQSIPNIENYRFNENQLSFLKTNGFVLVKKSEQVTNFYDIYQYNLSYDIPNYVTIDSILQTTSKIIQKNYIVIETEYLYPAMSNLTKALYDKSLEYYIDAPDPLIKKAALDNCSYFAVGLGLLNISCDLPSEIKNIVSQEIELIRASSGIKRSPIFQANVDYSFYQPKGYYRKDAKLSLYYQAREWFSRKTFILESDMNMGLLDKRILHNIRCTLIIYMAINEAKSQEGPAKKIWEKMHQIYSLFSQTEDNYTFNDYDQICFNIFKGPPSMEQLCQDNLGERFIKELRNRPKNKLYSNPMQFALFNTKFYFNQYVLSLLKDSSFDFTEIMSVFDASIIKHVSKNERREAWENIKDKMENLEKSYWFNSLEIRKKTFNAVFSSIKKKDPLPVDSYMWSKRIFLTAIGSWLEMTEDILLKVKTTEKAGNPVSSRIKFTRGFIDPYPEIYRTEEEVMKTLLNKLTSYKLISEKEQENLNRYITLLELLAKLAEKEIEAKKPLNNNDYSTIWKIGYQLKELSLFPDNYKNIYSSGGEKPLSQIVLIGYDKKGQGIEVAIGNPLFLYVVIPDGMNYNIACGPVYSYYEFNISPDKIVDNDDWYELIKTSSPAFPFWVKNLIQE